MESVHPDVQGAADKAEAWVRRFCAAAPDGRHLVLCGQSGVGKTHIMGRLHTFLEGVRMSLWPTAAWNRPPSVHLVDFGKICRLDDDEWVRWMGDWVTSAFCPTGHPLDALFLDDIGSEVDRYKSGEPALRLAEIWNEMRSRWLVTATNVPVAAWTERWGVRVSDRLFRNSVIADMSAVPSWQVTKLDLK